MKAVLMRITSSWLRGVSEKEISRNTMFFGLCNWENVGTILREETRKVKGLGLKNKEVWP